MSKLLVLLALLALSMPAWAGAWDTDPPCVWINQWHCVAPDQVDHFCVQVNPWHCVPPTPGRKH